MPKVSPTPPPVEQEFAELLTRLNIEIPAKHSRSVAHRQRLAEDIMETFIDVAGDQLVKLLAGQQEVTEPLDRLEVLVSLYYTAINDTYIGTDSHLPSRFREVHPFLLDYLAEGATKPPASNGDHPECYAHQRVRIVPHTIDMLNADLQGDAGDQAREYFEQHEQRDVVLLQVNPGDKPALPAGEWTGDLGLWVNTCALLFEPSINEENRRLRLEQIYPSEDRFKGIVRYVSRLIEKAGLVEYRDGAVHGASVPAELKEHLLWSLGAMFEPGLADVWDEFVDAPRRTRRLGPFVERQIRSMKLDTARIFDAAMGTGAESIYLAKHGHQVTSNEIEPRLIAHAFDAALEAGVSLQPQRYDWRHLEHMGPPEQYDVVLVLGNSLSCLPSVGAARTVLTRFAYLLRPNGRLIVDERNYPLILTHKREMSRRTFRFPPNVVYCSKTIQARPAYIPDKLGVDGEFLELEYLRADDTSVGKFKVLPFAENQITELLEETGFGNVDQYYNLRHNGGSIASEFVTYVARRTFVESGLTSASEADAVIAFTDISRSTPLKKELGPSLYDAEWRKHDHRVRKIAGARGGRVANSTGDGFLMVFEDSLAAVECMAEIVRDPGSPHFVVRAGISKGRINEDEYGNVRGREVDVAARICDAARPDRLIVDDRVRLDVINHDWVRLESDLRGVGARQLWRLDES